MSVSYEEELERRNKPANQIPKMKPDGIDFPQQADCQEEEVLADQDKHYILSQEEREPAQVKEEQEEFCIGQEGELLVVKVEADTFMTTPVYEENNHSEVWPNTEQLLFHHSAVTEIKDEEESQHVDSGSTKEEPKPKTRHLQDALKIYDCKEANVLDDQQLSNQTSSLDQKEQDAAQVKEEELSIHQSDHSETQPTSGSSSETESHIEGARKNLNPGSAKQKLVYYSPDMKIRKMRMQFTCKMCSKKFIQSLNLKHHMKVHTGENAGQDKKERLCIIHEEEMPELKQETDTLLVTPTYEENYHCETKPDCAHLLFNLSPEAKSQVKDVFVHKRLHTDEKPHPRNFSEKQLQYTPRRKSNNRKPKEKKPILCETCGKCFKRIHDLIVHVRSHTGEKPYCCETCGKHFTTKGDLSVHTRIHTGEKPHLCGLCGKSFTNSSSLSSHMRMHTGVKPYCCEKCGKSFAQRSNLSSHVRIHTGEKPFSCETCGKRFARCDSLKAHVFNHSRLQCCQICGKSFIHSSDSSGDMSTDVGEKPYSCETCRKYFTKHSAFNMLMRIHSSDRVFESP
ncbi:uncharacterized protein KZ484_017036 [Pholidichthys leucotaenia]